MMEKIFLSKSVGFKYF